MDSAVDSSTRGESPGTADEAVSEKSRETEGKSHHPQRSTSKAVCLVATCTFAMIANNVNNTAVAIALPTIGKDLNIKAAQLQWLMSGYSLSSGCLFLFFGRLADLYGRKKAFLLGSLIIVAFSIGCGFAHDEITLNVLRGFQGLGAAATIPASLGILAHAFPPSHARSVAFATFAAGAPVGAVFGMVLGGILIQLTSKTWRSTFWLAAGLAFLCILGGLYSIDPDQPSEEEDQRVDWIGAALVTMGLVLVVFVLGQGEIAPHQWKTPYIIVLLIIGVLFLSLFITWQWHLEKVRAEGGWSKWAPPPLMLLSIWKRARGRFAVMQAIAFLEWSCFVSWQLWVQLYYQNYKRLNPILTMIRLLPMFVTGVCCNIVVALVVGRVPMVYLVGIGTLLTGVAAVLFAVIKTSAPYWAFGFPAAITAVFGADFVFASGTIFVAKVALPHEQSMAGGLFQTMTQIGTAFGLTITTIIFNKVTEHKLEGMGLPGVPTGLNAPPEVQLAGYRAAQWGAFALCMLGTVLNVLFLSSVGIVGHSERSVEQDKKADVLSEARMNKKREAGR